MVTPMGAQMSTSAFPARAMAITIQVGCEGGRMRTMLCARRLGKELRPAPCKAPFRAQDLHPHTIWQRQPLASMDHNQKHDPGQTCSIDQRPSFGCRPVAWRQARCNDRCSTPWQTRECPVSLCLSCIFTANTASACLQPRMKGTQPSDSWVG